MSNTVIELNNVKRMYHVGEMDIYALRGISFLVKEGEFLSIVGPSGSGKSTCMNMIGCLDRPSEGDVIIGGTKTANMKDDALARLRNKTVGFVFQQYHLLSTMTVIENVMLPLRYMGLSPVERVKRAKEVLELVGLSDRLKHRPSELSGGQKQRTAIARALASKPQIILADEPTGALDSATGKIVMSLFREINKEGTTIVIVTHDPNIAATADRRIHILDGIIAQDEKLQNISEYDKEINL